MEPDDLCEVRGIFNAIHRDFDAERLDAYACVAAYPSGIGRLSYVTDEVLVRLVQMLGIDGRTRLLDLGCGNGFLGRWLRWRGIDVARYLGVDCSDVAIESARRLVRNGDFHVADFMTLRLDEKVDVACALEATKGGFVGPRMAEALIGSLAVGGKACASIVAVDGSIQQKWSDSLACLDALGAAVRYVDLTADVAASAALLSEAISMGAKGGDTTMKDAQREAARVVEAVGEGTFGYGFVIVDGVADKR